MSTITGFDICGQNYSGVVLRHEGASALRISLILSGVHPGKSKVVSLVNEHIVNCNKHKAYTESFSIISEFEILKHKDFIAKILFLITLCLSWPRHFSCASQDDRD